MKLQPAIRLLIVLGCLSEFALGQSNLGSITGVVKDAAGSSIPNAEIVVTNSATGVAVTTQSNEQGIYIVSSLNPAPYTVEARLSGFKTLLQRVQLQTAQDLRLDVTLETGDIAERVDVESSAPLLSRESAEVSTSISARQVQSLPLKGRNPYSVLILAPGVSPATADPANPAGNLNAVASVNGSRSNNTHMTLDGVALESLTGVGERAVSTEALQEVKILTSTYSAEYAQATGGAVLLQVKSGTQEYHGSVYEYHNNSRFNANRWELNARNIAQPRERNDEYGGTFGGPVPFAKNKLFFFTSYEAGRPRTAVERRRTIPDAAIRTGDFSSLRSAAGTPLVYIRDPLRTTGLCQATPANPVAGTNYQAACFPNNVIPANRLDPAALRVVQLFPAPNVTGIRNTALGINTSNYVRVGTNRLNQNYFVNRVDYAPTERDKFYFTFGLVTEARTDNALDFDNALNSITDQLDRSIQRYALSYNRIITPTISNELLFSLARDHRVITPWFDDYNVTQELGIARRLGDGFPTLSFSGAGGFGSFGDSGLQDGINQQFAAQNITTYLRGRHTVRFGGHLFQHQELYQGTTNTSGSYNFTGVVTGGRNNVINAYADFLLGAVSSANAVPPQPFVTRVSYDAGFFVNDDFKVSQRLTLNLGLRYDIETLPVIRHDIYSRVDPANGQLLVAGRNASRNLNRDTDYLNFAPRVGLAYSFNDDTVIRAGFGIASGVLWQDFNPRNTYTGFTFAQGFAELAGGRAQPFSFSQGFPIANSTGVPDPLERFAAATPANFLPVSGNTFNGTDRRPYNMQWSLSGQRSLPFDLIADVAYIGSRGVNLSRNVPANNPTLDRAPAVAAANALTQALRPYPNLGGFNVIYYDATSTYHSLQAKAVRRISSSLSVDANYTFSKNIDDASPGFTRGGVAPASQIPWQFPELERALAATDRTHIFAAGAVYDVPVGRGRRFFGGGGVASAILGGFQLNALFSAATGLPLTVTQNLDNRILVSQRPNVIDPGNLSGRIADPFFEPTISGAYRYLIPTSDPRFPFQRSSAVGIGNLGRNTVRAPGFQNWNLGLFRQLRFSERFSLQLRFEAYNAFNKVNLLSPSTSIDSPEYGLITGAAPGRNLQFGAKFIF